MRKIALLLALLLLVLPITANAATARSVYIKPGIKFNETTATCTVSITGDSMKDEIEVTVKLWQDSSCIATWKTSGTGYVYFSQSKTVTKGKEYKLTADVSINGIAQTTSSFTSKCE